jgi:hypothetical protein
MRLNVCFGSLADMTRSNGDVRFAPESGRRSADLNVRYGPKAEVAYSHDSGEAINFDYVCVSAVISTLPLSAVLAVALRVLMVPVRWECAQAP